MNHIIPIRNELSAWALKVPFSDSRMTLPNHPNIMPMMVRAPIAKMIWPEVTRPFSQFASPTMNRNMPIVATIGQRLLCGT